MIEGWVCLAVIWNDISSITSVASIAATIATIIAAIIIIAASSIVPWPP